MNGPTNHSTTTEDKEEDDGMKFPEGATPPNTTGKAETTIIPTSRSPIGHASGDGHGGRDGRSLEIHRFAHDVLGDGGDRHVESSETGETAEDEEGEKETVEWSSNTEAER